VKGEGLLTQVMGAVLWVVVVAVCDRFVGEGWQWYVCWGWAGWGGGVGRPQEQGTVVCGRVRGWRVQSRYAVGCWPSGLIRHHPSFPHPCCRGRHLSVAWNTLQAPGVTAGTAPAFASLLQSFPRALDGNCFPQVPFLDEASFPVNPGVCGVCSPRNGSWGLHPLVPLHEN
jgi:hypothetical protein